MALPHPHGNASGQIAHNSSYDTGVTPGSTGGKFIGFGEEGISFIANRANWALSENIDYLYDLLATPRAIPSGESFTSAGQSNFHLSDSVWTGDASYPADEQEGLLILFAVLDENYNELQDSLGHEVRVAVVRDTTNAANVYKQNFVTTPWITFKTIDSTGADVANPYTIPASTEVRIICGKQTTLETLPVDALVKFKLQSASEVEAGTLLQDGTRPLTANWNVGDHAITNLTKVTGPTDGHNFDVESTVGSSRLRFKDAITPAYICLSQTGHTAIDSPSGLFDSILGGINATGKVMHAIAGNRCLDRTGNITFTGGSGNVAWPTLNVCIDGEARIITSGSITATNNPLLIYILVVTAAGTVVERASNALLATDIPLASYTWTGAAFTRSFDIRWKYNGDTRNVEITCGDVADCNFGPTELHLAIELACRMGDLFSTGQGVPVVRVCGKTYQPSTVPKITLSGNIIIQGNGISASFIESDETNGHLNDFIDCLGYYPLVVRDLTVVHRGHVQAATLSCFKNPASNSEFTNLRFLADEDGFSDGFANCFLFDVNCENVLIEHVTSVTGFTNSFVMGSSSDLGTAYLKSSRISDVYMNFAGGDAGVYGIVANGVGNTIENISVDLGITQYTFVVGDNTKLSHCTARGGMAAVYYQETSDVGGAVVRDCYFSGFTSGISTYAIDSASVGVILLVQGCHFVDVGRPFDFSAPIATADKSYVVIDGNVVENTNEFIAQFENIKRVRFINNHCRNIGGDGVVVGVGAGCLMNNNYIEGYGSAGTHLTAVFVALGLPTVSISGNQIGAVGAPGSSFQLDIRRKCIITDNHIVGSTSVYGVLLYSYTHLVLDFAAGIECTVSGNLITGQISGVLVGRGDATVSYYNGSRITNNHISGQTTAGVFVSEVMGVVVESNEFGPMYGIGVHVRGTAAGGSSNQIVGNKFTNVEARGVGSVIWIEDLGSGGSRGCLVANNHLEECGTQHNPSLVISGGNFLIKTDADDTSIVGNFIKHLTGGNNPSVLHDVSVGILVGAVAEGCLLQGNTITKAFDLAGHVAERFFGIHIDAEECACYGNMIDFRGTQASVFSDWVCGIYGENDRCSYVGNMIRGAWARASGSFSTSFALGAMGAGNVVVGNWANGDTNHNISATGSGGVVIGNVAAGTNVVDVGSNHPSATAYNANTAIPRADQNAGTVT